MENIDKDNDLKDAMSMLGAGYAIEAPPREIFGLASGYTPAPDVLSVKYGFVTSLVWGRLWRYCQGRDGVCRAKLGTIAQQLGMSERTIIRHIEKLIMGGYFEDTTPDLKNRPHIYRDTGKLRLAFSTEIIESGVTESHSRVTESQSGGDRESVEDSNNKRVIKKRGDWIDGLQELYQMPGAKKVVVKEYIESVLKVRLAFNPSGRDAEKFINYAADRKIKDDQGIDKFINWWLENFPERKYWSFSKMEQNWPAAFMAAPVSSNERLASEIY